MDSRDPLPMPVRNYAEKLKVILKKTNTVQREPPRRRLDIHMVPSAAQTNLYKKIQNSSTPSNHKSPRQSLPASKRRGLTAKVLQNSNHKSPKQRIAVCKTRGLASKVPRKSIAVRQEARSVNNISMHSVIPVPRTESLKISGRKSHVAANRKVSLNRRTTLASQNRTCIYQPSKLSEEKVLEADISGVMLLEDDVKSEIGAGECSNNIPSRISPGPIQISDNRTNRCRFDDAFNSLQKEYLAQLSEFHAGWMQRFLLLFKTKTESEAGNSTEARDEAGNSTEARDEAGNSTEARDEAGNSTEARDEAGNTTEARDEAGNTTEARDEAGNSTEARYETERSRRKSARLKQKDFINSLAKDTPCRITKSALKQMNILESPWIDS